MTMKVRCFRRSQVAGLIVLDSIMSSTGAETDSADEEEHDEPMDAKELDELKADRQGRIVVST